jgi:hypothetical protein
MPASPMRIILGDGIVLIADETLYVWGHIMLRSARPSSADERNGRRIVPNRDLLDFTKCG